MSASPSGDAADLCAGQASSDFGLGSDATVEWQWELDHPLCNSDGNATPTETAKLIARTVDDPALSPACAEDLGITSGRSPLR